MTSKEQIMREAVFSLLKVIGVCTFTFSMALAEGDAGHPWMNPKLPPEERAAMVIREMTLDEKISLSHGTGMAGISPLSPLRVASNGGAGYVVGIPRLGIPGIQMSDAAYGVRASGENGRYSTALPSDLAGAATWDVDAAYEYGALIGRELRAQGYNMSLGGGVNLTREPRNGRPNSGRKNGGLTCQGATGATCDWRPQALRPQRSGEWAYGSECEH